MTLPDLLNSTAAVPLPIIVVVISVAFFLAGAFLGTISR